MQKPFERSDRVGHRILEELSTLIRNKVNDPRVASAVITHVKMTRDLKLARIYYRVAGDENERRETARGFARARGFLKRELAPLLMLRYMPDLEFFYDSAVDREERIEALFKKIHEDSPKESE